MGSAGMPESGSCLGLCLDFMNTDILIVKVAVNDKHLMIH